MPQRIPLAEVAERVDIHPQQTAAIVAQVAARIDRWIVARQPKRLIVPALEDLALERGGRLWWRRGQCVPTEQGARALGRLLAALLARAPHGPAPPGLLYLVSRSTDPRHLAPLTRVDDFMTAVVRHAPAEPYQAVDALMAKFLASATGTAQLGERASIADVRRWRRAGGVSLQTIAADTGIPASLLRELEWGVYANWAVPHADGSISAYAERAGIDPAIVIRIVSREQAEDPGLPAPLVRSAAVLERRHQTLPYAFAATLVLLLPLLTPGDTPERMTAASPQEPSVVTPYVAPVVIPVDLVTTQVAGEETADTGADGEASRPAPARPARAATSAESRLMHPAAPRKVPPNPLVRVARAIAGDGKHRVEPFPRPAADRQPEE